jgi:predicted enzyme related to lactoylglutathione lyase
MSNVSRGSFVWYDLLTRDPWAAVAFYTEVLGWRAQPFPGPGPEYTIFSSSQGPLAGTAALPAAAREMNAPPHWTSNVFVEDAEACATQAVLLGGRMLMRPMDFPGVGKVGVIADPQGAPINIFQPARPMPEHEVAPGEFTWSELLTTDHEAAFAFHSRLFAWKKVRDFDLGREMGTYLIYSHRDGGRELGGMFTRPPGMPLPPMWFYYVEVADLDATMSRATTRGGKVMNGPMPVPGGARIVQLMDPQGAAFALHEAARA